MLDSHADVFEMNLAPWRDDGYNPCGNVLQVLQTKISAICDARQGREGAGASWAAGRYQARVREGIEGQNYHFTVTYWPVHRHYPRIQQDALNSLSDWRRLRNFLTPALPAALTEPRPALPASLTQRTAGLSACVAARVRGNQDRQKAEHVSHAPCAASFGQCLLYLSCLNNCFLSVLVSVHTIVCVL